MYVNKTSSNADIFFFLFFLYVYVGGKVVIKWKSTVFFRKIVAFPHPSLLHPFYNKEGESTLSGVRENFPLRFLCTKELKAITCAVR